VQESECSNLANLVFRNHRTNKMAPRVIALRPLKIKIVSTDCPGLNLGNSHTVMLGNRDRFWQSMTGGE
jgi:hypothetical protein